MKYNGIAIADKTKIREVQLVNSKALAQKLSLSLRQIQRLDHCEKIPRPLRIAGSLRWSEKEIDKWIKMGCPSRQQFEELTMEAENDK